ncbi:MAG TPA: tail fiber domain-containing protein, partial [Chitinophagaceae bacterium]|nr:tail fiber domain-containing protein [Chitinophagaceae bacterium]
PQATLHVAGGAITSPSEQRAYFHVNTSNIAGDVNASGNVVMRVDGWIWANGGGFVATSDARIKNIIGRTNNQKDLATINKIEITNYKYKDELANGAGLQKKVIAQQVKEIYPIAVNQNKGIIPNVFEVAKQLKVIGDATMITTSKPHAFKTGDEVKFIFNKTGERTFTVTVKDAHTFSIPITTTENVFVYGKNVNDLLNVDYDALTTLNISATQQLDKEIEEMKAEFEKKIAELQKQLSVFAGK